jgi:myosin-5
MLSPSPSAIARSSLEEMLDSLRRRDEEEKPKDLPPALPSRPMSRGRLPPAKRSLPKSFKVDGENEKEKMGHRRRGSFGSKKLMLDWESPYVVVSEEHTVVTTSEQQSSPGPVSSIPADDSSVAPPSPELEDDNVSYFIKKVTKDFKFLCQLAMVTRFLFKC